MHKSSSKGEKLSAYENGKYSDQNVEKLSRKMEQFEKILTKVYRVYFPLKIIIKAR